MWSLLRRAKKILEWSEHFTWLRELLGPTAMTVATLVSGYLQHIQIMWIIMASSLVFMATSLGITIISLYLERNNPLNKLQFSAVFQCDLLPGQISLPLEGNRRTRRAKSSPTSPELGRTLSPTQLDPSVARIIEKGQLGVEIFNTASLPISCRLMNAESSIEGFAPPRSSFPRQPVTIPPGGKVRICDDTIDMEQRECGRLIGNMKILLKYGKPQKETLEYIFEGKVHILMEHYGFVSQLVLDLTRNVNPSIAIDH